MKNKNGAYHALGLFHVNLVANDNKGKVLGATGRSLDQEFVSPALQGLETLCVVDVEHEHAAVSPTVECNAQGLETLLSSSIPDLEKKKGFGHSRAWQISQMRLG
jgi:hypothetical protein